MEPVWYSKIDGLPTVPHRDFARADDLLYSMLAQDSAAKSLKGDADESAVISAYLVRPRTSRTGSPDIFTAQADAKCLTLRSTLRGVAWFERIFTEIPPFVSAP